MGRKQTEPRRSKRTADGTKLVEQEEQPPKRAKKSKQQEQQDQKEVKPKAASRKPVTEQEEQPTKRSKKQKEQQEALEEQPAKRSKKQKKQQEEEEEPTEQPAKRSKKQKKQEKEEKQPTEQPAKRSKRQKKQEEEPEEQEDEEFEEQEGDEAEDSEEQEGGEPEQTAHDTFMEEVSAKEQELQKHCLIMEQVETEEDETTLEQLRALKKVFVPQQVQDDFIEVWGELDEVGDGSEDEEEDDEDQDGEPDILSAIMRAVLGGKMLTTKHSAQMHTIFKAHQKQIDKAIKSKDWQKAFCRWAATLLASRREPHWYEDTDVPDDAVAIYTKMRDQWSTLKERSNEELGGLIAEGDRSPKADFDEYLQGVADDMKSMDFEVQDV